jgi:hypothetical protein
LEFSYPHGFAEKNVDDWPFSSNFQIQAGRPIHCAPFAESVENPGTVQSQHEYRVAHPNPID